MQKRVITPYPGAPDLSVYEDEDLDSAFSPKPEAELDHSCRYTIFSISMLTLLSFRILCKNYNNIIALFMWVQTRKSKTVTT